MGTEGEVADGCERRNRISTAKKIRLLVACVERTSNQDVEVWCLHRSRKCAWHTSTRPRCLAFRTRPAAVGAIDTLTYRMGKGDANSFLQGPANPTSPAAHSEPRTTQLTTTSVSMPILSKSSSIKNETETRLELVVKIVHNGHALGVVPSSSTAAARPPSSCSSLFRVPRSVLFLREVVASPDRDGHSLRALCQNKRSKQRQRNATQQR